MSDEQEQIEEFNQLAIDMRNQRDRAREERDKLLDEYRVHHEEAERLTSEIDETRKQRDQLANAIRAFMTKFENGNSMVESLADTLFDSLKVLHGGKK